MDKTYGFTFGATHVTITTLQDGASCPVLYAARKSPDRAQNPLYGFGATEIEAVVDLFRAWRDKYGVLPEKGA